MLITINLNTFICISTLPYVYMAASEILHENVDLKGANHSRNEVYELFRLKK